MEKQNLCHKLLQKYIYYKFNNYRLMQRKCLKENKQLKVNKKAKKINQKKKKEKKKKNLKNLN